MNKILFILFFYCGVNLTIGICQNYEILTYDDFERTVNNLEQEEKYIESIELTKNVLQLFPDKRFELIKELEFLNKKTERYQDNLVLWKEGHSNGFFFLLNKQMKQYEPYLSFVEFDSLVINDIKLRSQALEKSKSIYEVFLPNNYSTNTQYPLLLILHGGGSNIDKAKQRWKIDDKIESQFIVVFLQSYRHYDSKTFGWRSLDSRAHQELKGIYNEVVENYLVDKSRILIGGTSAGGTMAIELALNQIIPATGVIGFCPGKPQELIINNDRKKDIKIFMLGGELDYYLQKQKELAEIFTNEQINFKHIIVTGMEHEFPSDYEMVIKDALLYINQ